MALFALLLLADTSGRPPIGRVVELRRADAAAVARLVRPALRRLRLTIAALDERRVGVGGSRELTEAVWLVQALDLPGPALESLRPHISEISAQATSVGDALRRLRTAAALAPPPER
jgi:hypothetical protein